MHGFGSLYHYLPVNKTNMHILKVVESNDFFFRLRGHKKFHAQSSMKIFLLMNIKMPTIVGILTFMSRKNSSLDLSEPKNAEFLDIFMLMSM